MDEEEHGEVVVGEGVIDNIETYSTPSPLSEKARKGIENGLLIVLVACLIVLVIWALKAQINYNDIVLQLNNCTSYFSNCFCAN